MKNTTRMIILVTLFATLIVAASTRSAHAYYMSSPSYGTANIAAQMMAQHASKPEPKKPELTHAQTVWLGALEWCESHGDAGALNKKDRDGTPSYGAFQFKPGTFDYYGKIYKVIPQDVDKADEDFTVYDLQYAIVKAMVLDQKQYKLESTIPRLYEASRTAA